jgi:hypothetical protein
MNKHRDQNIFKKSDNVTASGVGSGTCPVLETGVSGLEPSGFATKGFLN